MFDLCNRPCIAVNMEERYGKFKMNLGDGINFISRWGKNHLKQNLEDKKHSLRTTGIFIGLNKQNCRRV